MHLLSRWKVCETLHPSLYRACTSRGALVFRADQQTLQGGYEIMIRTHSPFLCIFGKLAVGTHHPQIGIKYQPAFDIKINAPTPAATPGIKYQPAF